MHRLPVCMQTVMTLSSESSPSLKQTHPKTVQKTLSLRLLESSWPSSYPKRMAETSLAENKDWIPRCFSARWLSRSLCCPCQGEILNCLHSDSGICEVKFPSIQTPLSQRVWQKSGGASERRKNTTRLKGKTHLCIQENFIQKALSPQETAGTCKLFSTLGHCPPQGMKSILSR